jgi:hypothetical protein
VASLRVEELEIHGTIPGIKNCDMKGAPGIFNVASDRSGITAG